MIEWRKITGEQQPSARFGHSGVLYREALYIFGGWDGMATLNDLWRYCLLSQTWLLLDAHCALASRYRHSAVVHRARMYIFGGVDKNHERFGDLH
jgi:N-acetylneuraminic acid mutarotase